MPDREEVGCVEKVGTSNISGILGDGKIQACPPHLHALPQVLACLPPPRDLRQHHAPPSPPPCRFHPAVAMETLPLFLDRIVSPLEAILISVTAVLLFGEIVPQSLCTK
eukprot:349595-Chlamydomonas_euryale.AAC.1